MKKEYLLKIINDLPDGIEICGSGHFGEMLDFDFGYVGKVKKNRRDEETITAAIFYMENPGPDPD
jgi:hypothetical protein